MNEKERISKKKKTIKMDGQYKEMDRNKPCRLHHGSTRQYTGDSVQSTFHEEMAQVDNVEPKSGVSVQAGS